MRGNRIALAISIVVGAFVLATQAQAAAVVGGQVFSQGGEVTVEVLPATAGFVSELHLCSPGSGTPDSGNFIALNTDVGTVHNLGSYPAGTELVFCIFVRNTGDTFYMGPASRNADGEPHAQVDQVDATTAIVGFEDLFGGGDRDYDDNVFKFTGVGPANADPDCSGVTADPPSLWPPNHKFKTVNIGGASDPDGDVVTLTITGITQDEAVPGPGQGHAPDAKLIEGDSDSAEIRAERDGDGDGRVYRIAFTGDDGNGGTCEGTATVSVPHDESGDPAVDSGGSHDSLAS